MRNPEDYISNMIELGGARNAFRDLQDDSGKTSVPITMEQFYDTAEDADYLIYNASIDSTVKTLDDLLAKDSMLPITKQSKRATSGQPRNRCIRQPIKLHSLPTTLTFW